MGIEAWALPEGTEREAEGLAAELLGGLLHVAVGRCDVVVAREALGFHHVDAGRATHGRPAIPR